MLSAARSCAVLVHRHASLITKEQRQCLSFVAHAPQSLTCVLKLLNSLGHGLVLLLVAWRGHSLRGGLLGPSPNLPCLWGAHQGRGTRPSCSGHRRQPSPPASPCTHMLGKVATGQTSTPMTSDSLRHMHPPHTIQPLHTWLGPRASSTMRMSLSSVFTPERTLRLVVLRHSLDSARSSLHNSHKD